MFWWISPYNIHGFYASTLEVYFRTKTLWTRQQRDGQIYYWYNFVTSYFGFYEKNWEKLTLPVSLQSEITKISKAETLSSEIICLQNT